MSVPPWTGDLHIRPGVIAFSGRIGAADQHAHAAVQLYRCRDGGIEVTDAAGASVIAPAVVTPARPPHSARATEGTIGTTVFLDPSGAWAPAGGAWTHSVHGWADEERAAFAATTLEDTLREPPTGTGSFGARIEEWVRDRLPDRVVVADLASSLSVSEATLRRYARADLGLSVQAYTRWVRLIVALEQVATGSSITDAAAAAGFADGSHATRACREMFGLAPSDAIAHLTITRN